MHKVLIGIFVLLIIRFSIIGLLQGEGQMKQIS
jgi:hypothetical protein